MENYPDPGGNPPNHPNQPDQPYIDHVPDPNFPIAFYIPLSSRSLRTYTGCRLCGGQTHTCLLDYSDERAPALVWLTRPAWASNQGEPAFSEEILNTHHVAYFSSNLEDLHLVSRDVLVAVEERPAPPPVAPPPPPVAPPPTQDPQWQNVSVQDMQVQSQKPHFKDRFRNLFGPPIIKKRQPRKTNAPVPAGDPPPPKKRGRLLGKKKAGVDAPGYHPDPAQQPIETDNNRAQAQEPPLPVEVPGPAMSAGLLQGPGVAGGGERGYPYQIGGASNAEAGPSMVGGSAPPPVQHIQVQDAGHQAVMIPVGGHSAPDRTQQQQQTGSNRAQAQESGLPAEAPRMPASLLDNAPFRFAPGQGSLVIANDRSVDRYAPQGSGMTGGHHGYTPHATGFSTHAAAGPSTASSGFGPPAAQQPTHLWYRGTRMNMDPLYPRYNPPVLAPPYPYPYPPYPYPTGAPRPARRRVLQQPRQHQAPQDVQPGRTAGVDERFSLGLELRAQMGQVPPADHDGNIRRAGGLGVPPNLPPPEPDPQEAVNAFLSRVADARRSMNPRASRQDTTGYASRPSGMAGARRGHPLQIAGVPNAMAGSSTVGGTSLTVQDMQAQGEAADEQDKDGNGQPGQAHSPGGSPRDKDKENASPARSSRGLTTSPATPRIPPPSPGPSRARDAAHPYQRALDERRRSRPSPRFSYSESRSL